MPDSIYKKNADAMRSRFADVIELIEKPSDEISLIDEEKDVTAGVTEVDGKKILVAQKGDITYRMDSLYDSGPMLDLWFKGLREEWDLDSRLYMYGLGNGMFVRKFLKSARPDCAIVVHEPSYRIFKTVIENFDISDIMTDKRVRFVFWPLYPEYTVKHVYESIVSYTDVTTLSASHYPNYTNLFPKNCEEYVYGIQRSQSFVLGNQDVYSRFGADYNRNTFHNFDLFRDSYSLVKLAGEMPEDIPAIIVAAGPSLDKNIKELARAKGKCIIISTDTALKPLSLAGIVPDIAAMADGKKDERYLSEADSRQVPIVCSARCGDMFLHLHTGKKMFFDDSCYHLNNFLETTGEKMIHLLTGGSVANTCFSLARLFHCKRIILVGQDLAYTGDKTHSAVTVRGSKKTAVEDLEHVEMDVDINGDPIRTSGEFRLYKEWFEQRIDEDKEIEVVDATEGGIRIKGTALMTLHDAIDKYCTDSFDFSEVIEKAVPLFDEKTKERFDAYVREVPDEIGELRRIIRETMADYKAMRRLVQNDDYHSSRMKQLFDKCQRQTKRVENSKVIEYVHNQLQDKSAKLLDKVNKLEKDEKSELLVACDMGETYLKDMDQAIEELQPYMEEIRRDFGS